MGHSLFALIGNAFTPGVAAEPLAWTAPILTFVLGIAIARARGRRKAVSDDQPLLRGLGVGTYREKLPEFHRELERVRRYDRSLAIVVVKLDEAQVAEVETTLLRRRFVRSNHTAADLVVACGLQVIFARVGHILRDFVRDIDVVAWDVIQRRFVVLLPEHGRPEAVGAAHRLEQLVRQGVGVGVQVGVAEFRTDGLLVEDLVEAAAANSATFRREETSSTRAAKAPVDGNVLRTPQVSVEG